MIKLFLVRKIRKKFHSKIRQKPINSSQNRLGIKKLVFYQNRLEMNTKTTRRLALDLLKNMNKVLLYKERQARKNNFKKITYHDNILKMIFLRKRFFS